MKKKISTTFYLANLLLLVCFSACSVNRAKVDNSLGEYFEQNKVEGCFTLFNNTDGKVTVYNLSLDTMRFQPAATFEIANALIGLEIGKISDEQMVIKWDGIQRADTSWNKDLTMQAAFKANATPYFQEVARRIGRDTLKHWVDSLHYGNMIMGKQIDNFWLDNSMKISPDEQLGLVKRLYFDQLPFQKRTQQIVRDAMKQVDNTLYSLYYKEGYAIDEKEGTTGWMVGWVEENKHPYFFVTLVKYPTSNMDMKKIQLNITQGILKQMGFFEGAK